MQKNTDNQTTQAIARLSTALGKIYHNASLPRLCELDDVDGGLELASLLDATHNPKTDEWVYADSYRPSLEWVHSFVFDNWLGAACADAVAALAATLRGAPDSYCQGNLNSPHGRVYQYGRGGRTLAPNNWVKNHGGSRFSIKTAEEMIDGLEVKEINTLATEVEAFNTKQAKLVAALPQWWREYLTEAVAKKLAELQQAERQRQAASMATKLYAQHRGFSLILSRAAHAWAYAQGHADALSFDEIETMCRPENNGLEG